MVVGVVCICVEERVVGVLFCSLSWLVVVSLW